MPQKNNMELRNSGNKGAEVLKVPYQHATIGIPGCFLYLTFEPQPLPDFLSSIFKYFGLGSSLSQYVKRSGRA
jgi:hypothetical protein